MSNTTTTNELTQAEMQEYIRSVQTLLNNIASAVEQFKGVQSTMMSLLPIPVSYEEKDIDTATRLYAERGYGYVGCDLDLLELVLQVGYGARAPRIRIASLMADDIDAHLGGIAAELNKKVVVMTKEHLMATFVSREMEGKRWVLGPLITTSAHPLAERFREVFEDSLMFFTTGKCQLMHDGSEYFHMTKVEVGDQVCYRIEMVGEEEE